MNSAFQLGVFLLTIVIWSALALSQLKYTDQEKEHIAKFRDLMKNYLYRDYMQSDSYLIRWLRVNDFNQPDARQMLLKALQWRKSKKIDTILDETIYSQPLPAFYFNGTDYEGSLVLTAIFPRLDIRGFIVSGKKDVPIRYFEHVIEASEQEILRRVGAIGNNTQSGSATDLATLIVDMQGFNLRQHACISCISIYLEWFQIYENYYPGYTKHLIFINTPRIYAPILEILKPVMSKQTRNAIKVFGPNKKEWQEQILKIIPADQLIPEIGRSGGI